MQGREKLTLWKELQNKHLLWLAKKRLILSKLVMNIKPLLMNIQKDEMLNEQYEQLLTEIS